MVQARSSPRCLRFRGKNASPKQAVAPPMVFSETTDSSSVWIGRSLTATGKRKKMMQSQDSILIRQLIEFFEMSWWLTLNAITQKTIAHETVLFWNGHACSSFTTKHLKSDINSFGRIHPWKRTWADLMPCDFWLWLFHSPTESCSPKNFFHSHQSHVASLSAANLLGGFAPLIINSKLTW